MPDQLSFSGFCKSSDPCRALLRSQTSSGEQVERELVKEANKADKGHRSSDDDTQSTPLME
ncbi:hypothetical protein MJO28_004730 [Puccinia striiformis f. sp. tritici]|uniref:Uncharacterized protein n=1 Tax=Puccinia striiformis f. sp. tritici TaxID=168172 RepID=A0ACC0EJ57_9BASI|nr:hypothetical protein MJO28_004730 [Puccinia striiformis f. sp. tritici]